MKAMGIVGYKDSGKTTLTGMLADALEAVGHRVAIAKFTHQQLDRADTDTMRLMKPGRAIVGLGEDEAALFWGRKCWLPDLLPLISADILLVEGGKNLGWLPRIVCLRVPEDESQLHAGLGVAAWEYAPVLSGEAGGLPRFTPGTVPELANMCMEQGFILPALDCGACGEKSCAGLARRIVAGTATQVGCKSLGESCSISVNGVPVGMNPFVAGIISGAIKGMLQELKGVTPGTVEIRLNT